MHVGSGLLLMRGALGVVGEEGGSVLLLRLKRLRIESIAMSSDRYGCRKREEEMKEREREEASWRYMGHEYKRIWTPRRRQTSRILTLMVFSLWRFVRQPGRDGRQTTVALQGRSWELAPKSNDGARGPRAVVLADGGEDKAMSIISSSPYTRGDRAK